MPLPPSKRNLTQISYRKSTRFPLWNVMFASNINAECASHSANDIQNQRESAHV